MNHEEWIDEVLSGLRDRQLERRLRVYPAPGGRFRDGSRELLNFSSNDYLDLARHPAVVAGAERALKDYGAGAAASRLVTGTLPIHEELEARLAALKGCPSALVFGSGYLANAGVIPSLAGRDDTVFADRLVHASVIDAITLSRARLARFHHNDAGHLAELLSATPRGRRLVVTESVFSMDGDLAPLRELADAAARFGAMLMIDEAHATGVFGPSGSGLVREEGLEMAVNVSMGTLSKAVGSYGGFVACSPAMRALFVNRARAFIYTTAPPPAAVGAALGALDVMEETPGLGEELLRRAEAFRRRLTEKGLDTMSSASQIVPVKVGGNDKALAMAERLRGDGILAVAIRPPTVPQGTARLRLSVTLAHTAEDLERAADVIAAAAQAEGVA